MQRLSIKLSESLYQDLSAKAQQHELNLSDTMRECLQLGLQYFRQQPPPISNSQKSEIFLQKRSATHSLFTYCLLEHFIRTTIENGKQICDIAETKAEKLTESMLEKLKRINTN